MTEPVWSIGYIDLAIGVYGSEAELRALNPQATSTTDYVGPLTVIGDSQLDARYFVAAPPGAYYLLLGNPSLRLTQRNDGTGINRHPRLRASRDASSSRQTGIAPRVGDNNRYL